VRSKPCAIGDSTLALDGAEEDIGMNERRLWAIVLAGGEGSRLAETDPANVRKPLTQAVFELWPSANLPTDDD
jgi:hypothetical protein